MTTFLLRKRYDYFVIENDDADLIVARVYPHGGQQGPYRVTSCIGSSYQRNECGVVKSLEDAIAAFIDYHEKNPVQWEWVYNEYWKSTLFVILRVVQDQRGGWLAYRNDYPLLRDGKVECFATHTDAQRAADAHELDLFPNAKAAINDGFSWQPDPEIDWRSVPHLAEQRANWRRSALFLQSSLSTQGGAGDVTTPS